MAKNRKYAREPLLYIHQPSVTSPNAPMQHSYATQRKVSSTVPAPEAEKKTPAKVMKKRSSTEIISQNITKELQEPLPQQPKKRRPVLPVEENEDIKDATGSKPSNHTELTEQAVENTTAERKKFRDMSIMEKVEYFINTPQHLPRMRSEVRTDERKYRGVIMDLEEDEILMRVGRRSTRIKMEDITDIQLLGF